MTKTEQNRVLAWRLKLLRIFFGPGINLNQFVRTEVGYMNQYTFRNNGPDKNDHILAANVFVNF